MSGELSLEDWHRVHELMRKYFPPPDTFEREVKEKAVIRLIGNYFCGHCESCHEDADCGYDDLMTLELGKGRYAEVCCRVQDAFLRWMRDKFKKRGCWDEGGA